MGKIKAFLIDTLVQIFEINGATADSHRRREQQITSDCKFVEGHTFSVPDVT